MPSKEQPCIVGNQTPRRTSPGRAREGRNPLAPVTRGGVGEQSAPRSRRRKQRPQKNSLLRRKPKSPSEQPRESARGCEPSRLPIEADDLRVGKVACPLGKQVALRPTKRNRRFRLVALGADFFGAGACPPEKKSLPCRFRARKSAGFQRNLRKRGAEGKPSPPPPGELERAAVLSNFNQKHFCRKSYPFPRGAVAGELAPPSTSRALERCDKIPKRLHLNLLALPQRRLRLVRVPVI